MARFTNLSKLSIAIGQYGIHVGSLTTLDGGREGMEILSFGFTGRMFKHLSPDAVPWPLRTNTGQIIPQVCCVFHTPLEQNATREVFWRRRRYKNGDGAAEILSKQDVPIFDNNGKLIFRFSLSCAQKNRAFIVANDTDGHGSRCERIGRKLEIISFTGAFTLCWTCAGVGYGTFEFTQGANETCEVDNESMSRYFVEDTLLELAKIAKLKDDED